MSTDCMPPGCMPPGCMPPGCMPWVLPVQVMLNDLYNGKHINVTFISVRVHLRSSCNSMSSLQGLNQQPEAYTRIISQYLNNKNYTKHATLKLYNTDMVYFILMSNQNDDILLFCKMLKIILTE